MKKVSILYDNWGLVKEGFHKELERKIKQLEKGHEISINLIKIELDKIIGKLNGDKYDFIIFHLNGNIDYINRLAKECMSLTTSILVAESIAYPFERSEIYKGLLYIPAIFQKRQNPLYELLEERGFISGNGAKKEI